MRHIFLIALLLFGVTGYAQNRSATITKGNNFYDFTMDASDSINASDNYYVEITNKQPFPQMQDVYLAGSAVSGSGDIVITVYGKKFAASDSVSIGTTTWNSTLDLDESISVTTVNRYRTLFVVFVSDGTAKDVLLTDIKVKTWDTGGELSTSNLTLSGNLAVTGTATVTGETTLNNHLNMGAGDDILGSTTSDINIGSDNFIVAGATGNTTIAGTLTQTGAVGLAASATLGAGADLLLSTTSDITVSGNTFTVAGATGNTVVAGTLGVTGAQTNTAAIAANGGVTNPTESTHIWPVGGSVVLATAGTNSACTDGDRYWTEIMIPNNVTLTGISYLVGTVGGTDSVIVQLCNSAGTQVATTVTTGANHGALVGTAAEFQSIAFTTPYAATAGVYYVALQFNGTTAKFRTYPIPGSPFVAGTVAGTYDTAAGITPGTTFTADTGPILITY